MYIYISIYIYIHIYTYIYIYIYICTYILIGTTGSGMNANISFALLPNNTNYSWSTSYGWTAQWIEGDYPNGRNTCVYMYVYMCIHVYVYTYINIYMYISTYI
jgi:hypothetical protein